MFAIEKINEKILFREFSLESILFKVSYTCMCGWRNFTHLSIRFFFNKRVLHLFIIFNKSYFFDGNKYSFSKFYIYLRIFTAEQVLWKEKQ